MALGGGTFTVQNKILPGAYINFVSAARASTTLSDRGIATVPMIMDWGALGKVIAVTVEDLQRNSLKLFGYDFTAPQLKGLRDLFKNIRIGYIFRLGAGGTKAANAYATAKYAGERGNSLQVVIAANVDNPTTFDVSLYLDTTLVDTQTVASAAELTENDFVDWITAATLAVTAGTPLTGGSSPTVTNSDYQTYLDAIEEYNFNALGCPSTDETVKGLFAAFTKRMRVERGVKFQCVGYRHAADFEGAVNVLNSVTDADATECDLVYWVTGVVAGTAVNRSATNKLYDGEYTVDTSYTQAQLENAIQSGQFALHRVAPDVRVLLDINSLVTITEQKGEDFKSNQTIRVIDQIANDTAALFNTRYLGEIPNDEAGRISLWSDIVRNHRTLQTLRAIENFASDDIQVTQGDTKRAVKVDGKITVINGMEKLYMTTVVA